MSTKQNITPEFVEFYRTLSRGDNDALAFLLLWHEYCHQWDDAVDLFLPDKERLMRVAALAIDVYSCAFYQRHAATLSAIAKHATATFLLSAKWEKDDDKGRRLGADVLRHCGNDMVYAVADLVGGWAWRTQAMDIVWGRVILDRNEPD